MTNPLIPGPLTSIEGLAIGDILRVIDPGEDTGLTWGQLVQVRDLDTDIDRRHVHHSGSPGPGGHYFSRFEFVAHDPSYAAKRVSERPTIPLDLTDRIIENVCNGMAQREEWTWDQYVEEARDTIRRWDNIELLEAITFAMETR